MGVGALPVHVIFRSSEVLQAVFQFQIMGKTGWPVNVIMGEWGSSKSNYGGRSVQIDFSLSPRCISKWNSPKRMITLMRKLVRDGANDCMLLLTLCVLVLVYTD